MGIKTERVINSVGLAQIHRLIIMLCDQIIRLGFCSIIFVAEVPVVHGAKRIWHCDSTNQVTPIKKKFFFLRNIFFEFRPRALNDDEDL